MPINSDWTVYAPIIIVFLVAIFGYFATRRAVAPDGWYQQTDKSPYTPHRYIFVIAWTILYILIIISWIRANSALGYNIIDKETYDAINWLFVIDIILNLSWSFLFFGDANIIAGLVILILSLITTGILIFLLRFDTWASSFMLLYFIWLLFATYLNWYIISHNHIIHLADFSRYYLPL